MITGLPEALVQSVARRIHFEGLERQFSLHNGSIRTAGYSQVTYCGIINTVALHRYGQQPTFLLACLVTECLWPNGRCAQRDHRDLVFVDPQKKIRILPNGNVVAQDLWSRKIRIFSSPTPRP
jgi:hypothetical protein